MLLLNPYRFGGNWSPADISTALWLDASDSGTVTLVTGDVSQWDDKSGNGINVTQGTAGNRPTLSAAAQNGLDVISFNGSSDWLISASAQIHSGYWSAFAVANCGTTTGTKQIVTQDRDGTGANRCAQYLRRTNLFASITFNTVGSSFSASNTGTTTNWGIQSAVRSSTAISHWLDGTAGTGGTPTGTPKTANMPITVGARETGTSKTEYFNGSIAEIILLSTDTDASTRQKLEGYLAHKWGLTSNLPSDHPYKSSPP